MLAFNRYTLITVSSALALSTGYAHADAYDEGVHTINQVVWDTTEEVPYQETDNWTIPENQTHLVFVRAETNSDVQSSANIGIDGRFQVSLQDGHYSQVLQCAGTHRLSVDTTGNKTNDLDESDVIANLAPQTTHYFYVEVDANGEAILTELNEENGLGMLYNKFRQTHQVSRVISDCANTQVQMPKATEPDDLEPEYIDVGLPSTPVVPAPLDPVVAVPVIPTTPAVPSTPVAIDTPEEFVTDEIIVINRPIKLGVLFDTDSANIRPVYNRLVEDVADFMEKYPTTQTIIEGHTDSVGDASYNLALSRRRAAAVKEMLVTVHGADPTRLTTIGYGETQPIESNDTEEGRQINRRVVATIMPQ